MFSMVAVRLMYLQGSNERQTWRADLGTVQEGGWDEWREHSGNIHLTIRKTAREGISCVINRELNPWLCDNLRGWEMGRGFRREGTDVYL